MKRVEKKMKVDISENNFCKLIDGIEDFYRMCSEPNDIFDVNLDNGRIGRFINILNQFLVETFEGDKYSVNNPYFIYDIDYYMWELDFGKKWESGVITIDDKDIPLRNSHDLWNLITDR